MTISASRFEHNQAIGGSDGNSGPGQVDPGVDESFGGAISLIFPGTLDVTGSTFSYNAAIGGNNATATGTDIAEVGVAEGGTICNELGATASFADCTFDHNQATGGHGNTASGPVVDVGSGFGAGIFSGFGGVNAALGPDTLTVQNSILEYNISQGGDHNSGTASVEGLVGVGTGAGIMNFLGSTATVSNSILDNNQANGGRHNTAAGTGAVFAGLGAGGAIYNGLGDYNSAGYGPFDASVVTVTGCSIDQNTAQGGGAGNGEGGGIANVLSATTTVTESAIILNEANGAWGGAGLGGGAFNDATSTLELYDALVTQNQADGSPGIGGGIYTVGTFTQDSHTRIIFNFASTSNDNIYGTVT